MSATVPEPTSLIGSVIRLDPMGQSDLPELFAAIGRPEVFAGGYGGGPAGYRDTYEGFEEFALRYYALEEQDTTFVARILEGDRAGEVVGTSTLANFHLPSESAHLGWTAWTPSVWGTVVNPEAKLLMIDHLFAHGFGRVKLQADELNERSRAAILKLGATFEGIVRRDMRRADGSWRNTAQFSILADEWPELRERLVERIAAAPRP